MRLAELLSDLLATRGGTWEELWRVHDAALAELVLQAHLVSIAMLSMAIGSNSLWLAELVLQVGVPCAERG